MECEKFSRIWIYCMYAGRRELKGAAKYKENAANRATLQHVVPF